MAISFLDLFLAIFSHQMAIYISSKSFIKKLNAQKSDFTLRKMPNITILLYLYSSLRILSKAKIIYPFFRTSPNNLQKICTYYIVYILHKYLFFQICQCPLNNIIQYLISGSLSASAAVAEAAAAAAAAAVALAAMQCLYLWARLCYSNQYLPDQSKILTYIIAIQQIFQMIKKHEINSI